MWPLFEIEEAATFWISTPEAPPVMEPELEIVSAAPAQRLIGPVVWPLIVDVPTQVEACAGVGIARNDTPMRAVVPMSVAFSVLDPNISSLLV